MTVAAMQLAGQQMGLNENTQNAALQEYMANGGVNLDPAVTAWCAAFVNASLGQVGMQGTGSNMARSFENWGQPVDTPQRGDLAVFHRNGADSGFGHVGFFEGYDENGQIRVLGGNQGDSVSISSYSPSELLGFRRGEGQPQSNALASMPQQGQTDNQLAQLMAMQAATPRTNALDASDFMTQPMQNALIPLGAYT